MEMNKFFGGNYIRVRVGIDLFKPLIHFTPLNLVGKAMILLPVTYKMMDYFCEVCAILGHDMEECGDGILPPKKEYGKWMLAKWRASVSNQRMGHGVNYSYSQQGRGPRGQRRRGHRGGRSVA